MVISQRDFQLVKVTDMKRRTAISIFIVMVVLAATTFLTGCKRDGIISRIFATPIEEVIDSPQRFENRTITIAGKVTRSGGIGKKSAYLVEDETGSIWVLDNTSAPAIGEEVRIRGQPSQWLRFGNKSLTVFKRTVEQKQKK
jgi:hypothetical protein